MKKDSQTVNGKNRVIDWNGIVKWEHNKHNLYTFKIIFYNDLVFLHTKLLQYKLSIPRGEYNLFN